MSVRGSKLHERPLRRLPESPQSKPLTWSDRGTRWSASRLWLPSRLESNKPSSRSPEDRLKERKPKGRRLPGLPWNRLSVSHSSNSRASRTSSAKPLRLVNTRINRPTSQLLLATWTDSLRYSMTNIARSPTRAAFPSAFLVRPHLLVASSLQRAHSATTICSDLTVHLAATSSLLKRSRPQSNQSPRSALPCQASSVSYSSQRSRIRSGRWSR